MNKNTVRLIFGLTTALVGVICLVFSGTMSGAGGFIIGCFFMATVFFGTEILENRTN